MSRNKCVIYCQAVLLSINMLLTSCKSPEIPSPRNVHMIESYNLNPLLGWDAPLGSVRTESGSDEYEGKIVLYDVHYYEYEDAKWILKPMWDCVNITQRYCHIRKTPTGVYEGNIFVVLSKIGNLTSKISKEEEFEFTPYTDGVLVAPNVNVTFNGSSVVIDIDLPTSYWSHELLQDVSGDPYLAYKIRYWTESVNGTASTVVEREIQRSDRAVIPVKATDKELVCFQMQTVSILMDSSNWSDSRCVRDKSKPFETTTSHKSAEPITFWVVMASLAVFILGIIVCTMWKLLRRLFDYVTAKDDRTIPVTLLNVIDSQEENKMFSSPDYQINCEVEPAILFVEEDTSDPMVLDDESEYIDFLKNPPSSKVNQYSSSTDCLSNTSRNAPGISDEVLKTESEPFYSNSEEKYINPGNHGDFISTVMSTAPQECELSDYVFTATLISVGSRA